MTASVSAHEKRDFVKWFLKNYQLKRRESVWILNYLMSHEELLENVHFVEGVEHCPRGMMISTTSSSGAPFRFYKGTIVSADAEKSFHDMRLHPNEPMYVELKFPDHARVPEFLAVLEDNPYVPMNEEWKKMDQDTAEFVVDSSIRSYQLQVLENQIDQALDEGDRAQFEKLSRDYQTLVNQIKEP